MSKFEGVYIGSLVAILWAMALAGYARADDYTLYNDGSTATTHGNTTTITDTHLNSATVTYDGSGRYSVVRCPTCGVETIQTQNTDVMDISGKE